MDSYDYLRSGVMNGNAGGFDIPDGIDEEMLVAMLDTCDDIIDQHRRKNRAFDVACDEGFRLWTSIIMPFSALRVGMRIFWSNGMYAGRSVTGVIIENPGGKIVVERDDEDRIGGKLRSVVNGAEWLAREGYVTVPVPVDGATLGRYPNNLAV